MNGIGPPDNQFAQYGQGFYTFRDRDDAERWSRIREESFAESSAILAFEIPDDVWMGLKIVTVLQEHEFILYDEAIAAEYETADVLEGPWARTISLRENEMAGAWQYKFSPWTFHVLNVVIEVITA